jgi:hypothetical protein
MMRAVERGDEPVEALELKVPKDGPVFINVRFAGYRCCWADIGGSDAPLARVVSLHGESLLPCEM